MTEEDPAAATDQESTLRAEICSVGAELRSLGLTPGTSGNISVRLGERGFLVTPTGVPLGGLDPVRLTLLDDGGRHIDGDPPTKEVPLHLGVYRGQPRARAVVHLHATHAAAVSCIDGLNPADCLPALTAYHVMKVGRLPLLDYFPPGAADLSAAVEQTMKNHHALLLSNHGLVAAGAHLSAAAAVAEEIEETAKLFLMLRGTPTRPLSTAQSHTLRLA